MLKIRFLPVLLLLFVSNCLAQSPDDPFPDPIAVTEGVITVGFEEFAVIPDYEGQAARVMILVDEPGTGRMFVNDMRGPIYAIGYQGGEGAGYIDINEGRWGVQVNSGGRERGMQSFAFHPQFGQPGSPGYGKFYTWTDVANLAPEPDFVADGEGNPHDTVLHEWTARTPGAASYDGDPPRELMRFEQPFGNHNGGQIGFNPFAAPGDEDFGLLYVGIADGGSGGDPMGLAQNLRAGFGKIMRIDPLGSDSANGRYGIPDTNPFLADPDALDEIYAYGVRNPQRFAWDPDTGAMYFTDIGQNIVEEISPVTSGANLGWNEWEGSFRFISRSEVGLDGPRADPAVTYPIAEYGQIDPLLQPQSAATGLVVYRDGAIPQLQDRILWGDMPSGEIFHLDADNPPDGFQSPIRRVLLEVDGQARTLLEWVQAKNREQGRDPAGRADLRFGVGPDSQVLIMNKGDGVVRRLVP